MKDVSWTIYEGLTSVKEIVDGDDYDVEIDDVDMSTEKWDEIVIPGNGLHYAYIILLVGVCREDKHIVRVRAPCSRRNLLTAIKAFYDAPPTERDIEAFYEDNVELKDRPLESRRGGPLKRSDLNGDAAHFEGLQKLSYDTYEIILGS